MRRESTTNRFEVMQASFPGISGRYSLTAQPGLPRTVDASAGRKPDIACTEDRSGMRPGAGGKARKVVIIFTSLSRPQRGGNQLGTRGSKLRAAFVTTLGLALVAGPAAAFGQTPTDDQYDPTVAQISAGGGDSSGSASADTGSDQLGSLPFTGLDLVAMAAAALCLTALGIVLYRRSRRVAGGSATS